MHDTVCIWDTVFRSHLGDEFLYTELLGAVGYFQDFQTQRTVYLKILYCLRIMSHIIATPPWMMYDIVI